MGEMAAGPALDVAVAERVLGMVACDRWESINLGSAGGPAWISRCEHELRRCYPNGAPHRYSQDWAAMGELVESLTAQGKAVEIALEPHQPPEWRWQAVVDGYYALAATWPHAVCLAALAALQTGAGGEG